MPKIGVVTDSCAILPPAFIAENPVAVAPLTLLWEGREYRDGIDLTAEEFYVKLKQCTELPSTSHVSVTNLVAAAEQLTQKGCSDILFLPMAKNLGNTFQAAVNACLELLEKKIVRQAVAVDSQAAAGSLFLLVHYACSLIREGCKLPELVRELKMAPADLRLYATFETLEFLARGGRVGKAAMLVANTINIKPLICLNGGEVLPAGQALGRNRSIKMILKHVGEELDRTKNRPIVVMHSAAADEANMIAELLNRNYPEKEIVTNYFSPVMGTHTGPGLIAVSFWAK
jgi:DegV family protein with EDD domain